MEPAKFTAAVLLVFVAAIACSDTPETPGDVLLITVDTLRPDHLGIYGYARSIAAATTTSTPTPRNRRRATGTTRTRSACG